MNQIKSFKRLLNVIGLEREGKNSKKIKIVLKKYISFYINEIANDSISLVSVSSILNVSDAALSRSRLVNVLDAVLTSSLQVRSVRNYT